MPECILGGCFCAAYTNTHLLSQFIVHLRGHGDSLVIGYDVVLEGAHVLCGAAYVGFDGTQNSAVVLPVAGQLLEDQRFFICFSLQGIYPHRTRENTQRWIKFLAACMLFSCL